MQAHQIKAGTLRDRIRGARIRAASLSPERRKEIAAFASRNRRQRERGEMAHKDWMDRLVHHVRASDPDLALFLKKVFSMPLKFQDRALCVLNDSEQRVFSSAVQFVEGERVGV